MRNHIQTSCSNSPVFIQSSASVQSIYLLYIALSSAPQTLPTCTLKSIRLTLICILFIHICFSSTSIINIASLPDSIPRSDVTEQSYTRSRSSFRRLGGLILRLTYAKPTTSCRCTRKKITNANQSQSWTQGQISILASQSIEKLSTIIHILNNSKSNSTLNKIKHIAAIAVKHIPY